MKSYRLHEEIPYGDPVEAERVRQLWLPSFDGLLYIGETEKTYEYESATHYGHINKNGWGCGKGNKLSEEAWQRLADRMIALFDARHQPAA